MKGNHSLSMYTIFSGDLLTVAASTAKLSVKKCSKCSPGRVERSVVKTSRFFAESPKQSKNFTAFLPL